MLRRALRWAAGVLLVLCVLIIGSLICIAALVDSNHLRATLIRLVAADIGRPLRVQGPITAHLLSFAPRLVAEGVTIENPPWMPPGTTAEVGVLSLELECWPLPWRELVIRRLDLKAARLHLVRDEKGRANWQWAEHGSGRGPPLIHSVSATESHLELDDARRRLKFNGTVLAQDLPAVAGAQLWHIEGVGTLNGRAASFALNGDPLASLRHDRPYRFAFAERSSGSRLDARGVLPQPIDVRSLELTFEANGEDLKDLYFLVGLSMPDTARYHLTGKMTRAGSLFTYSDLTLTAGASDLRGTLTIETKGGRPKVQTELSSQSLRWSDLGAAAAGRGPAPSAARPMLMSDTPLPLRGLRASDGVIEYHARELQVGRYLLHAVAAHIVMDHGTFSVAPLTAALSPGKITARLKLDATGEAARLELDLKVSDVRMGQFARKDTSAAFDGVLQGRLDLSGHGRSIHQFAASADGTVTAVVPEGSIRASLADLLGADLAKGLGLMLRKDQHETGVRCGIASFKVHDGDMNAQSLLLDTDPVLIDGEGVIRLDSESIDLTLHGRPKSRQLLRLRAPVSIGGTLAHPSVAIGSGNPKAETAKALAVGIVRAPLEVLGFVDPDLAKNADCAALLTEAKREGVPVSAPAVPH
jgi:uncharacterized protein involved in outer membrane biogenesis